MIPRDNGRARGVYLNTEFWLIIPQKIDADNQNTTVWSDKTYFSLDKINFTLDLNLSFIWKMIISIYNKRIRHVFMI